jgi:tetratricopeptide (TPR) repeat protein
LLISLISFYLHAQGSYDPKEVAMLPAYCKHTNVFRRHVPGGNNQAEVERLTRLMGVSFIHLHHYCWGLMATNRANLARTPTERVRGLNHSISEFDYVIRNASPDFILLPEILTRKGQNLVALKKGPLAIVELQRAIDLKPDYWPPYATLSDYYKETGDHENARLWLQRGLAAVPDSQALKTRLSKLDKAGGRK